MNVSRGATVTTSDKKYAGLMGAFILIWVLVFYQSLAGMVEIWSRSETFTHGFIIFPLAIWLLYGKRHELAGMPVKPSYIACVPLFGGALLWMLAVTADIAIIAQFMAVFCLVVGVWMISGWRIVYAILFPLLYLFFAVPAGENLVPALQDITAWITVEALEITGIPVFRDGLYLHLPSGLFEVAAACSGIRYLIASVAIGTLYAYLSYQTMWKRAAFILFAVLLPIFANGIRAYLIVIIAHYSDMEYATGADHLVYGWVFFGFVMLLMMYVGGLFAEPAPTSDETPRANPHNSESGFAYWPLLIGFSILALAYAGQQNINKASVPETPASALHKPTDGVDFSRSNWQVRFINPLKASHVTADDGAEYYRAVFANNQERGELISSINKFYSAEAWTLSRKQTVTVDGHQAVFLYLTNTLGYKRGIIYWYELDGQQFVNRAKMKVTQAVYAMQNSRELAEIKAVSMVSEQSAEDMLEQLTERAGRFRQLIPAGDSAGGK